MILRFGSSRGSHGDRAQHAGGFAGGTRGSSPGGWQPRAGAGSTAGWRRRASVPKGNGVHHRVCCPWHWDSGRAPLQHRPVPGFPHTRFRRSGLLSGPGKPNPWLPQAPEPPPLCLAPSSRGRLSGPSDPCLTLSERYPLASLLWITTVTLCHNTAFTSTMYPSVVFIF